MGAVPKGGQPPKKNEEQVISVNAAALRNRFDSFVVKVRAFFIEKYPTLATDVTTVDVVGAVVTDGASTPQAAKVLSTPDLYEVKFKVWCYSHRAALIGPGAYGLSAKPNQNDGHDPAREFFAHLMDSLAKVIFYFDFCCFNFFKLSLI